VSVSPFFEKKNTEKLQCFPFPFSNINKQAR
jgi:hypothetical protein